MKKTLNCVLGLLFVGVVSSASAETLSFNQEDAADVPFKKCWDIISGKVPSLLLSTKLSDYYKGELYLVGEEVYRFSVLDVDRPASPYFYLGCEKIIPWQR